MEKSRLKKRVLEAIDENAQEIRDIKMDIWAHPELGFKEDRTSEKVAEVFDRIGLDYSTGIALTGVRAELSRNVERSSEDSKIMENPENLNSQRTTKRTCPKIGIFGELDAVVCWDHPNADRTTGAVHACGHDAQVAAMLGAAIGLSQASCADYLDGSVVFFGVPAEEFVELEYREKLREEGKIEFFGGKQELLRLGALDDVDIAQMTHVESNCPERFVKLSAGSNGFVGKTVQYVGKEAHAGAAPYLGVNALNAAMLGIMGIHAQRETFKDEDHIRVHPIITRGGDLVNIVPSLVRMETYVRGAKTDAILEANRKVNMALRAGGMAVGAQVVINEIPGYLPYRPDQALAQVFAENAKFILGESAVETTEFSGGSTDMGDVSHLIPSIHPYVGGIEGAAHSRSFRVVDLDMVSVIPAKILAMTVIDLLWDEAREAKRIIRAFHPAFTKEEYLSMWRDFREGK